jgi:hypothetical protein
LVGRDRLLTRSPDLSGDGPGMEHVQQRRHLLDVVAVAAGQHDGQGDATDLVLLDRGYDHDKYRRPLWAGGASSPSSQGVASSTARSSGVSAGLSSAASRTCTTFRRLRTRYERYLEIHHQAFLALVCSTRAGSA